MSWHKVPYGDFGYMQWLIRDDDARTIALCDHEEVADQIIEDHGLHDGLEDGSYMLADLEWLLTKNKASVSLSLAKAARTIVERFNHYPNGCNGLHLGHELCGPLHEFDSINDHLT